MRKFLKHVVVTAAQQVLVCCVGVSTPVKYGWGDQGRAVIQPESARIVDASDHQIPSLQLITFLTFLHTLFRLYLYLCSLFSH